MNNPHSPLFARNPLAQLALSFSAGIISTNHLTFRMGHLLATAATLTICALIGVLKRKTSIAGACLLAAICLLGASLALIEKRSDDQSGVKRLIIEGAIKPDDLVEVIGRIDGPQEFARDRVYLQLRVESVNHQGIDVKESGVVALLVSLQDANSEAEYRQLQLGYGSRIRVKTTLDRTDRYRNPGVSVLTEFLDLRGYDASGFLKSPRSISRLSDGSFTPLRWLYRWREDLQGLIDSRFSPETAGVLDAALLGNRYNLSRSTSERFREGGTFHVLVISGLHISFLGGLVLVILRRFSRSRWLQCVIASVVVWGYTIAVGADASVVRAALMFTFVAAGTVIFRRASSVNALGGAALALLLWSPKELFNPSLQLTFLSVLAIVAIAWPLLQTMSAIGRWHPTRQHAYPPSCTRWLRTLSESLYWSDRYWQREIARSPHVYRLFKTPAATWLERYHLQVVLRHVFGAVTISICVQVSLLPFLIIYFHRLSLASLLLNIGVSILLGLLAFVALLALLLAEVSSWLSVPFLRLAEAINWLMLHSVDPFTHLGLASMRLPEYSGRSSLVYVCYYLPLLVIIFLLSRWRPLLRPGTHSRFPGSFALIAQSLMCLVVVLHPLSANSPDGRMHVDFLDVGQGDSALVTLPNGTTLLVDGGGQPNFMKPPSADGGATATEHERRSIGESVVCEYLWWKGLDQVDYVLATHADADHIDGLNDVLRNFSVRSALVGRTPVSDPEYAKFAQTLAATGTPVTVVQAGDEIVIGNVKVRVLWPPASASTEAASQNNDSVVLRIQFGETALLLTGDIESEAENALLSSHENLSVDVVKAPHHGSKTSSTSGFVAATRAPLAVISVGQKSMFGHPHKEVVDRWRQSGAEVLTTGASGTISVVTDGWGWSVSKFVN